MKNNPNKLSPKEIIDGLENFLKNIKNINECNKSEIDYLLAFFDNISQKFLLFNRDFQHIDKENSDNNFNINLSDFYLQHVIILSSFSETGKKIKDNIIVSLKDFSDKLNNDYKNIILKINSIISNLKEQNTKVEKIKNDYYQENNIFNDTNIKLNKNNCNNINSENQSEKQDKFLLYKNEIDFANKLFLNSQKEFKNQLKEIENIEENKRKYITTIIDNYIDLFDYPISTLKSLKDSKNNNNQDEYLKKEFKFQYNNIKENSILNNKWDIFTFQLDNKTLKLNKILNNNFDDEALTSLFINIQEGTLMKIEKFDFGANDDFEILSVNDISKFYILKDQSEESNIKELCKSLFDKKKINYDFFEHILQIFLKKNDNSFFLKFLYCFTNQQDNIILFKFNNYENLIYFNTILVTILSNLVFENLHSINYQILYTIILISERTYYNDIFLCAILSKNKIFEEKNKWIELINYRIIYKLNKRIKSYINKHEFLEVTKYIIDKPYIIHSILSEYMIDYESLSKDEKEVLNIKDGPHIIHSILKDFINHMCNFNIQLKDSEEVVINICNMYNLKKEGNKFYTIYLCTSNYTLRSKYNSNNYNIVKTKGRNDIDRKYKKSDLKYLPIKRTNEEIIIILRNIYKFCEDKDLINILYLNKEISKKIKEIVYIERAKKNLKKKINNWKKHLKCNSLSNKFKYIEIKQKVINNKITTIYDRIIDLDAKRTSFKKNIEENKKKTSIILKACIFCANHLEYCQGMNFIIAYLLELTENEEESFYIMLGLLYSDFKIIFQNDLDRLTIFFYVLEKLIYLKIPEIYEHLKLYKIDTNFFSSSYFITLFTNIYPYFDTVNILALNKLFDYFIFKGWKNIFSSLLGFLYYNKDMILKNKDDDLMTYLISGMIKSDIFKNENIFLFCRLCEKFAIPDTLYSNLNKEKELELNIDFINLDIPEEQTVMFKNYYDNNN